MDFSGMLFYGGIASMAFAAIVGIVVIFLTIGRKKSLVKKLESEYGKIE